MRFDLRLKPWRSACIAALLAGVSAGALAQEAASEAAAPQEPPPADAAPAPAPAPATAATADAPPAAAAPAQPEPATIAVDDLRKDDKEPLPASDDGHTRLESVVVTANKRQQLLQDVPMSISAIQGKDLEKKGAKTFVEYAQTVPALNFGSYGEGRTRINIRGLQAPTGVATVAYLVDGISQSNSAPDSELFDVDRVEILRGPQGTLYGEGAVGGAIKIITNSANPSAFVSKILGSVARNAAGAPQHDVNAMLNIPLINGTLGARIVGFERHADGYITVREPDFNNPPGLKSYSSANILATKANDTNVTGGRIALDWKALDTLAISAKYSSEKSFAGAGPAESPSLDARYPGYNVTRGVNPLAGDFTRHYYNQASLNVNWEAPWFNVESVTGMADVKEDLGLGLLVVLPLVETAAGIGGVTLPAPVPGLPPVIVGPLSNAGFPTTESIADMFDVRLINQYSYITQEFRVLSQPNNGPWTWTGGVFYKIENREAYEDIYSGPNLTPVFGHLYDQVNLHFFSEEYALYGQGEYAINDKFSLLVGARYYRANLVDTAIGGGTDGTVFPLNFSDVSPKFTLSYHLNDHVLFYTTAAKGFRAGGVNFSTVKPPPTNGNRFYSPDVLWSYEVGVNSALFDGRMTANAAVFTSDWKNLQNEVLLHSNPTVGAGGFESGGNERYVINAGKAYARGVEFELTTILPLDLTWTLGGAYLDAAIGADLANPGLDGGIIPKGTSLENVPHLAGSSALTYDRRLGGGLGLSGGIFWSYRGQSHADILNPRAAISKAYQLINLQLGLKNTDDVWSADLFANNIFNKNASSFTFQNTDLSLPLAKRTVGVRMHYNF